MERSERRRKGSKDDSANVQFWCNPGWIHYDRKVCTENSWDMAHPGDRAGSFTTFTLESSLQIARSHTSTGQLTKSEPILERQRYSVTKVRLVLLVSLRRINGQGRDQ